MGWSLQPVLYTLLFIYSTTSSPRVLLRRDTTYTINTRNSAFDASFGQISQTTTVAQGATYWLSGGGIHNFFGNVVAGGTILATQTDYTIFNTSAVGLVSTYTGHDNTNGIFNISSTGSIILNDYNTVTGSSYDWDIRSFTNNGTMQWCGRGNTGGSNYQLICDVDCYNNGLIDWEQYFDNDGLAFNWHNTVLSGQATSGFYNIYNNGAFRLQNVPFVSVQNVRGNGCWLVGTNAVLYLATGSGFNQNPGYGPTWPNQNIYFTANDGTLHLDNDAYARNANFGPQIYNFQGGNTIEFGDVIFPGTLNYGTTTGILSVRFYSGASVNLKIGLGYVATGFSTTTNYQKYGAFNAIRYTGLGINVVPPSKCVVTAPTCTDPALTAGVFPTTATSSTSSTGLPNFVTTSQIYTGTGVITAPITTTLVQPSGTNPGVIAVLTPGTYTTTSIGYGGSATSTSTIAQPSGTRPGTVAIYYPSATATSRSSTTTSRPASLTTTIGPNQCSCTAV